MPVACPRCGQESGASTPRSQLQPLLDGLAYQNPQTLAAALRPGETILVLCRASLGGLAATDQRLLTIKEGNAHEYSYADVQDITVERVGWWLSAVFELVTVQTPHRTLKAKEADAAPNALSLIRTYLPIFEEARRRVLEIRDARRCASCGAFVPITPDEWTTTGRPELIEPIPDGGAQVLAVNLQPDERIVAQVHGARFYKSVIVTDRRVMVVLGRDEKRFHSFEPSALDGAEADEDGLYLWVKGRPRQKHTGLALVASDNGVPANAPDLPRLQQVIRIIEDLIARVATANGR